eukprot:TRINITY_DN1325_c0_g1_i10.p1 TRINITY_DN1325_c0_g1~~TRINITY_DN1325_c0_g1_i10.p1  ORF type:complete len:357 (-),score=112.31 TRINITY_DN1325_c0_g1_i10:1831-2901(-)
MTTFVRSLVSKKKIRFQEDGFDLDLTYITPRIIAMGFPSSGAEAKYRNPMEDVQRFFSKRHSGHFLIVNLCSERKYEHSKFDGCVCEYPFDDHNAPKFNLIQECMDECKAFLDEDEENVVALHCKAGKGRTGVMISCLLFFLEIAGSAEDALEFFAEKRTADGKGVTIPSQQRYVKWYCEKVANKVDMPIEEPVKRLEKIIVHTVPNFDLGGGCDPFFQLITGDGVVYFQSETLSLKKKAKQFEYDLLEPVYVQGDVKIMFWDWDRGSADDEMFWFWINTGCLSGDTFELSKKEIDGAVKDKKGEHFDEDFRVECVFESLDDEGTAQVALEEFNAMVTKAEEEGKEGKKGKKGKEE